MSDNKKIKIIAVVGPTASGKTALGVNICKRFGGEVVSADSMQIYKGMDIATAKPTEKEQEGIIHHLIDFVSPSSEYSVASFCKDAKNAVSKIVSENKLPVVVGGTGLYIDSFLNNISFLENSDSTEIRKKLYEKEKVFGLQALYDELKEIDPLAAEKIHINNKVKIIRALEVYYSTGKTLTQQNGLSKQNLTPYEPLYIGVKYKNREILYEKINKRVDIMMENGLLEEAKSFYSSPVSNTSVNAIGYKELKPFLENKEDLSVCIDNLKKSTRHYAKRQLTWFNRNPDIHWVYKDTFKTENDINNYVFNLIESFLRK